MSDDERFDALLMNIAQTQRGIEPLLDTVFSFLRRKTDFFTGASHDKVEDMVLTCVRKQAHAAEKAQLLKKKSDEDAKRKKQLAQDAKLRKQQEEAASKAKAAPAAPAVEPPRFEEINDDDDDAATPTTAAAMPAATESAAALSDSTGEDDDDGPPPVGNGGTTDTYVWTQTLQEAQATFAVPVGTKSRDVDVRITATKLRVALKSASSDQKPLADGLLFNKVKVDDSFWTLEDDGDGKRLVVYLQKDNQMEWWKTIVQGDAEIDTKKVQPENSKLGDLDADTRQTVEKMMFDQRQKAMGLPSSDEMQKQSVLQKFMAQHPEMDFSNAKIT